MVSLCSTPDDVAKFPRSSGYSSSGIVVETGENVKFKSGRQSSNVLVKAYAF